MQTIQHTFHFSSTPAAIIRALIREDQIQKWWTKDASIISRNGLFQWEGHGWTVELGIKSPNDHSVIWSCTRSNMQNTNAWEGSTMMFELIKDESGTKVEFTHSNYQDSPCFKVCSDGWNYFLGTSLKSFLETGKGFPYPETQNTSALPSE
jgi:uncharacterized protein YndB with AHSA1/START domain